MVAEDGRIYERKDIEKRLAINSTSPLDPSCSIDASQLRPNRIAKGAIESLVESCTMHYAEGKSGGGSVFWCDEGPWQLCGAGEEGGCGRGEAGQAPACVRSCLC